MWCNTRHFASWQRQTIHPGAGRAHFKLVAKDRFLVHPACWGVEHTKELLKVVASDRRYAEQVRLLQSKWMHAETIFAIQTRASKAFGEFINTDTSANFMSIIAAA